MTEFEVHTTDHGTFEDYYDRKKVYIDGDDDSSKIDGFLYNVVSHHSLKRPMSKTQYHSKLLIFGSLVFNTLISKDEMNIIQAFKGNSLVKELNKSFNYNMEIKELQRAYEEYITSLDTCWNAHKKSKTIHYIKDNFVVDTLSDLEDCFGFEGRKGTLHARSFLLMLAMSNSEDVRQHTFPIYENMNKITDNVIKSMKTTVKNITKKIQDDND